MANVAPKRVKSESNQKQYEAFLITPFGNSGDSDPEERRLHAGRVAFRESVLDAVEARLDAVHDISLKIVTGDQVPGDDAIYDKVVDAIVDYDFVIAWISGNKPNVYLEIGYADAYQRKPIIIHHDHPKTRIPSDRNNKERVQYCDEDLQDEAKTNALIDNIVERCLQRVRTKRGDAASSSMRSRTEVARGAEMTVFNRYSSAVTNSHYTRLLVDAESFIRISVPKLKRFTKNVPLAERQIPEAVMRAYGDAQERYEEAVNNGLDVVDEPCLLSTLLQRKVIVDGVDVKILTSDPDSFDPKLIRQSKYRRSDFADQKTEMEKIVGYWQSRRKIIQETQRQFIAEAEAENSDFTYESEANFKVILVATGLINYRATLTDQSLLYTFRYLSERVDSHHCIEALAPLPEDQEDDYDRTFYEAMKRELEQLISWNVRGSDKDFYHRYPEEEAYR